MSVLLPQTAPVYAAPVDRLQPFFCYFGGKWRSARRYPAPQYPVIVEPFAGGAGYSLHYPERKVVLHDVDPTICELWSYLIRVRPAEIMALPSRVEHVDDVRAPQEAKSLIGFWLNKGGTSPKKTPSTWARSAERPRSFWGPEVKERIAAQVPRIRHWVVKNRSYELARNVRAHGSSTLPTRASVEQPIATTPSTTRPSESGANGFKGKSWCASRPEPTGSPFNRSGPSRQLQGRGARRTPERCCSGLPGSTKYRIWYWLGSEKQP